MRLRLNAIICLIAAVMVTSCGTDDGSTKHERIAIKKGNKEYNKGHFYDAGIRYDDALAANMQSEIAVYNKSMSVISDYHSGGKVDSTQLDNARQQLYTLAENTANTTLAEKAIYNLGNDSFYMGLHYKDAIVSDKNADDRKKMQYDSTATKCFEQSIELYKDLLRRRPDNQKALQNLRIAQLQLPKNDNNGGDNNNNNNQQQQPKPQPQPQPQNTNEEQIMRSVQQKENQTRKEKEQKAQPSGYSTDKPW